MSVKNKTYERSNTVVSFFSPYNKKPFVIDVQEETWEKKYDWNDWDWCRDQEHIVVTIKGILREVGASPIRKVIFHDPATIVFWTDGTKTVVKCQDGDTFDKHTGLAMAISKKFLGNKGHYYEEFKRWIND